jgi:tetratricopeptide (TPR) repeat protein
VMTSAEIHLNAKRLRQEKKFAEALPLYEDLWNQAGAPFDGAGLLNCLRKLKRYDKAIPFAEELVKKFSDFRWAKNEAIWTYIEGKLNKFKEDASVDEIIEIANSIMDLKPEGPAAKLAVFRVLKAAKAAGGWKIVNEWTDKLNPEILNTAPMRDKEGREGWCDQSLWYNYKAKALIETDKPELVLQFIDQVISKFPRQNKFFLRLKALSHHRLGNVNDAQDIYKRLCDARRPDWWLLHEYARVLVDKGEKQDALKIMCQAAASHKKLEGMVTLFKEIGLLCKEIGQPREARAHLLLSSLIRTEQGWSIPESMSHTITGLNLVLNNEKAPSNIRDALNICRETWNKILGVKTDRASAHHRKPKRGLTGKLLLGKPDVPFCFIRGDDNESYFCQKSDLPAGITNGETIGFTGLPSFDKKKNTESWKAVDISRKN